MVQTLLCTCKEQPPNAANTVQRLKKAKVKEADLYSAFIEVYLHSRRSGTDHTVLGPTFKLHHTCLYLVSIHQMAHPRLMLRTSNCSLLLIYLPERKKG